MAARTDKKCRKRQLRDIKALAARAEKKCRIEKKYTTQQAHTALFVSEEKEGKEGKIKAVAHAPRA